MQQTLPAIGFVAERFLKTPTFHEMEFYRPNCNSIFKVVILQNVITQLCSIY